MHVHYWKPPSWISQLNFAQNGSFRFHPITGHCFSPRQMLKAQSKSLKKVIMSWAPLSNAQLQHTSDKKSPYLAECFNVGLCGLFALK